MKKPIYIYLKKRSKLPIDHQQNVVGTKGDVIADVTSNYIVVGIEVLDYDHIEIDGRRFKP